MRQPPSRRRSSPDCGMASGAPPGSCSCFPYCTSPTASDSSGELSTSSSGTAVLMSAPTRWPPHAERMSEVIATRAVDAASDKDAEEARIREAYARRQHPPRDSWFSPGHLFMIQGRERRVLPLLARHGFERLEDTRILEI